MSRFVTKLNMVSGKMEWGLLNEEYDYWQEIARSRYGDMLYDYDRNIKYSQGLKKAIDAVHARGEKARVLDIGAYNFAHYFLLIFAPGCFLQVLEQAFFPCLQ